MNTPDTVHTPSAMDHDDDSLNPFVIIRSCIENFNTRLLDLERLQKPGLKVKIENDGGEVSFLSKLLQERKDIEQDVEITIANKTGKVTFDAHSSWNVGGWAKLCLAAGAIFWYRDEICIIARGVLAGANLAMERWDERQAQKGRELLEGQEAGTEAPTQRKSHASVMSYASDTPATVNSGGTSSAYIRAPPIRPSEGTERVASLGIGHNSGAFNNSAPQPDQYWGGGVPIYPGRTHYAY